MQHTARTVPGPRSARFPAAALLAALVLALLATLGAAGPPPGAPDGPAAGAAAADHHRDTGPRADEGYDTGRGPRTATRQEPHREHPAPRCRCATIALGATGTAPGTARYPVSSDRLPSPEPYAHHDRGRAPPASSGT
ncbi:hypothetical protein ABZX30_33845 [Streptomyces sp. NPDC004542]|uniref:hypothetical protein n=1 Tax=Streptomyces sp. NPDC004542 TaxID=3154281 RepID=UPI0033B3CB4A